MKSPNILNGHKADFLYQFHSGSNELNLPIYLIVGAARSGKTLLGKVLGSCANAEYIDEPWLPMVLTMAAGLGVVERSLALTMVRTYLYELLNDRILMRHANFRPSDLTSMWQQKSPQEIFSRIFQLQSRQDVRQHISEKKTKLIVNLTDTLPYIDFLQDCLPGCEIIHVVHDGWSVAHEISKKHWYSDAELKKPTLGQLYRVFREAKKTYYMNFWVNEGEESEFVARSEYARGLYYWRRMMEMSMKPVERLRQGDSKYYGYYLPDLTVNPQEGFSKIIKELDFEPTAQTKQLVDGVANQRFVPGAGFLKSLSPDDQEAVERIRRQLKLFISNRALKLARSS